MKIEITHVLVVEIEDDLTPDEVEDLAYLILADSTGSGDVTIKVLP